MSPPTEEPPVFGIIRWFDCYPKVADDFKAKTSHGGTVTIICFSIIVILIISETANYIQPQINHEMFVDATHSEKLRVNLNVTFPRMPCMLLSLDTLDASGERHLNIHVDLKKIRLNKDGETIEGPPPDVNTLLKDLPRRGSFFGLPVGKEPSETEEMPKELKQALTEGCRMEGLLFVAKVAGNFHFSVHGTSHLLTTMFREFFETDVRHIIHELSFGFEAPGTTSPLDGLDRSNDPDLGTYQYYLKIVPTVFEYKGIEMQTNQYSVTEHFKSHAVKATSGGHAHSHTHLQPDTPAVYFIYELSPIMVRITKGRSPFARFLVGLCAIVGGVFTVAGIFDSFIHQFIDYLQKRHSFQALSPIPRSSPK